MGDMSGDNLMNDYLKASMTDKIRVGGGFTGIGVSGSMSCLQIYGTILTPGQIKHLQHCRPATTVKKPEPCPVGFFYYDDMCYQISAGKAQFAKLKWVACLILLKESTGNN